MVVHHANLLAQTSAVGWPRSEMSYPSIKSTILSFFDDTKRASVISHCSSGFI